MKRLSVVVTAATASAALAAAAIGTGTLPASAAAHPSARVATHQADHRTARKLPGGRTGKPLLGDPVRIVSQYGRGQYVSVVRCHGEKVPPPVHLRQGRTPIRLTGGKPTSAVLKATAQRGRYSTVYTCTIVVKKKKLSSPVRRIVTVNTGLGGAAHSVSRHRPGH